MCLQDVQQTGRYLSELVLMVNVSFMNFKKCYTADNLDEKMISPGKYHKEKWLQ